MYGGADCDKLVMIHRSSCSLSDVSILVKVASIHLCSSALPQLESCSRIAALDWIFPVTTRISSFPLSG
eukprot:scaffold27034_cov171-Amphora_coffeaeformis.AAC.3